MIGCGSPGCDRAAVVKGLCRRHYAAARDVRLRDRHCAAPGCERPSFCKGLCRGHYARSRRGRALESPLRDFGRNNVILSCRIRRDAMDRLREQAQAAGISPNKLGTRLLLQHLGLGE